MKKSMKQRLQIRFVLLSVGALIVLQTLIVGFSIVRSYRQITVKADKLIRMVNTDQKIPEVSDARYFIVRYNLQEKSIETDVSHTALVNKDIAMEYAKQIIDQKRDKGYIDDYRYLVQRKEDDICVTFLARNVAFSSFQSNSESLILLSLAGIGCMTVFLIIISGKIVDPIVQNRQKQKEFISSASHELKTPLTVIHADSQLLESEIGENEWLTDIIKQIKYMTEMTQRLVYLSRMEEQDGKLVKIDFPISDVAEDIVQSFSAIARNDGKEYNFHIQSGITYHGDEKAIRELMTVLLDNAFKYSTDDGKITVELILVRHGIRFSVENTVVNMDDSVLSHLTERFYRGNTSDKIKGFGVGLSIARAVTEAHKGKLIIKKINEQTIRFCAELK